MPRENRRVSNVKQDSINEIDVAFELPSELRA